MAGGGCLNTAVVPLGEQWVGRISSLPAGGMKPVVTTCVQQQQHRLYMNNQVVPGGVKQ